MCRFLDILIKKKEQRSPCNYKFTGIQKQILQQQWTREGEVPYRIALVGQLNVEAELVHYLPLLEPIDIGLV